MNSPGFYKQATPDVLFSKQFAAVFDKAANCLKDGECEEKCPYKLPIRDIMEENVALYQSEKQKWEVQHR
jgi:predicted aldo/keto reductase-like oxidoreductase